MAQSSEALLGIRLAASLFATGPLIITIGCLILDPISKDLGQRIQDDLAERRKRFAVD